MKYFGFEYRGMVGVYQTESETVYNTPHEALSAANKKWNSSPDPSERRLLVVIRECDVDDTPTPETMAFFQFADSQSCKKFVDDHSEIIWSIPETQQWNGDAKMMG